MLYWQRLPLSLGSHVMLALTVLIAQRAHATEPPAGHLLIAKSSRDFGGTQGENCWRYLFDRGDGTPTTPMPYFLPSWQWCVTPNYGGYTQSPEFSHCVLTPNWGHTNSAGDCSTPAQGTLRPIREWSTGVSSPLKLHATITPASSSAAIRIDVLVDRVVVWSQTWSYGVPNAADIWIDVPLGRQVAIRADPLGSCGSDGFTHDLEIYAPDCNDDGVADLTQIIGGELVDVNLNGIPDICETSISNVIPPSVPAQGGSLVTLRGNKFPESVTVRFGGTPADAVFRESVTKIIATTPALSPGVVNITVDDFTLPDALYIRPECGSDLDQNGVVDTADISIILLDFGPCYEPPAVLAAPVPTQLILTADPAPMREVAPKADGGIQR
ncbi:MAG: hypothetical protein EBR71_02395 [Planctomycetes bacterium]|nr:hypothetical protein [Planctomycetota bacterium]